MKVAVIGSRTCTIENIDQFIPSITTEIVSGGARGIDQCAREYAQQNGLELTEFLPEFERYGRAAPLKRNIQIIRYADLVIAFWDGKSHGTRHVIEQCERLGKPLRVIEVSKNKAQAEGYPEYEAKTEEDDRRMEGQNKKEMAALEAMGFIL